MTIGTHLGGQYKTEFEQLMDSSALEKESFKYDIDVYPHMDNLEGPAKLPEQTGGTQLAIKDYYPGLIKRWQDEVPPWQPPIAPKPLDLPKPKPKPEKLGEGESEQRLSGGEQWDNRRPWPPNVPMLAPDEFGTDRITPPTTYPQGGYDRGGTFRGPLKPGKPGERLSMSEDTATKQPVFTPEQIQEENQTLSKRELKDLQERTHEEGVNEPSTLPRGAQDYLRRRPHEGTPPAPMSDVTPDAIKAGQQYAEDITKRKGQPEGNLPLIEGAGIRMGRGGDISATRGPANTNEMYGQRPWTSKDGNPWSMTDKEYMSWRKVPENQLSAARWEKDNPSWKSDMAGREHSQNQRDMIKFGSKEEDVRQLSPDTLKYVKATVEQNIDKKFGKGTFERVNQFDAETINKIKQPSFEEEFKEHIKKLNMSFDKTIAQLHKDFPDFPKPETFKGMTLSEKVVIWASVAAAAGGFTPVMLHQLGIIDLNKNLEKVREGK